MAIEKWHPFKELEGMRREMDKIWDELFPARLRGAFPWRGVVQGKGEKGIATPAIDIIDRPAEVLVRAELPGVSRENIEIAFQDGMLTIKGEIRSETEKKEENYAYSERSYSSYTRSIDIPFKVEPSKIKATLKDGVLDIHLPKTAEEQPKKIKVDVS